jgi:hypothetical protein
VLAEAELKVVEDREKEGPASMMVIGWDSPEMHQAAMDREGSCKLNLADDSPFRRGGREEDGVVTLNVH